MVSVERVVFIPVGEIVRGTWLALNTKQLILLVVKLKILLNTPAPQALIARTRQKWAVLIAKAVLGLKVVVVNPVAVLTILPKATSVATCISYVIPTPATFVQLKVGVVDTFIAPLVGVDRVGGAGGGLVTTKTAGITFVPVLPIP